MAPPAGINAAWHKKHVMPKGATVEQRIAWHQAHQKHCGCRPMPPGFLAKLKTKAKRPRR